VAQASIGTTGVRPWLPYLLATTAGAADTIGFLALGGLFSAHITGNVVVLAAHYTVGGFSQAGPLLAIPVFVAVLGAVALVFERRQNAGSLRALLFVQAALLSGCLGLGIKFGPFTNPDSAMAVLVGMLAVAAMATQNAMVKLAMQSPSTAAMTTNTTQLVLDLASLILRKKDGGELAETRRRAKATSGCLAGFVGGCVAGAVLESHFGLGALALPAILAAIAIPLGT
jgi:uncharacterized membrane protein YoaK (UPF0700 family)